MNTWNLYPAITAPMSFQMAFDEILFRRALQQAGSKNVSPCLRFYFSSEPSATLGYSQKQTVPGFQLPFCRRMTGGGMVLHGRDLVFSMIAAKGHDPSFQSVRASYIKIHEAVKNGLERFGKKPRFFRCTENLTKGDDCFRFPIASDLALDERKVAGGAQKRSCGVFLHQESVQHAAVEPYAVMGAIREGFQSVFGVEFLTADLLPEFMFEAEELSRLKYAAQAGYDVQRVVPAVSEEREVLSPAGGAA